MKMGTPNEPIRGKVAKILNSREVALNIGKDDGVNLGMVFEILAPDGDVIKDPDSGETLGEVNLAKTRVQIKDVTNRFSVATTYRSKRVDVGGTTLFQPPKWETRYETLKKQESFESAAEPLDAWNSYVSIGDPVVQIPGAENLLLLSQFMGGLVRGQG